MLPNRSLKTFENADIRNSTAGSSFKLSQISRVCAACFARQPRGSCSLQVGKSRTVSMHDIVGCVCSLPGGLQCPLPAAAAAAAALLIDSKAYWQAVHQPEG
jgi:hypothetical protein